MERCVTVLGRCHRVRASHQARGHVLERCGLEELLCVPSLATRHRLRAKHGRDQAPGAQDRQTTPIPYHCQFHPGINQGSLTKILAWALKVWIRIGVQAAVEWGRRCSTSSPAAYALAACGRLASMQP